MHHYTRFVPLYIDHYVHVIESASPHTYIHHYILPLLYTYTYTSLRIHHYIHVTRYISLHTFITIYTSLCAHRYLHALLFAHITIYTLLYTQHAAVLCTIPPCTGTRLVMYYWGLNRYIPLIYTVYPWESYIHSRFRLASVLMLPV